MSSSTIKVTTAEARRFLCRAHFLSGAVSNVAAALAHHGYVQIDPINVCGRMHDLILRNRVGGYREGDLMRHLHGDEGAPLPAEERTAFEHHLPRGQILAAFSLEAWPYLLHEMEARSRRTGAWLGRLTLREKAFAPHLLAELAARGPLSSEDLHDGRRSHRGWGRSTLAKSTLQKLFFHGRVLIAGRRAQRRFYALPERVLPAAILARTKPEAGETARWLALTRLRQHRLVALKQGEMALVEDRVQAVTVEGGMRLHCLREDVALFFTDQMPDGERAKLLAPLDPMIYDRRLTARLWNFDYTWEVYTPPHKRVRGYYALPVLSGGELVGHVDPKVDRATGRLRVQSRSVRRGHTTTEAVQELEQFLMLKRAHKNQEAEQPADRANDEERDCGTVRIGRHGRAPRPGSSHLVSRNRALP